MPTFTKITGICQQSPVTVIIHRYADIHLIQYTVVDFRRIRRARVSQQIFRNFSVFLLFF